MDRGAGGNVVGVEGLIVGKLLAGVDEADLLDLDALLLLEGLLDGQDLVLGLEVEGLLAAGEGLDENLHGASLL